MSEVNQWYGWIPDVPDKRDRYLIAKVPEVLPTKVDLRDQFSFEVYDQKSLGSCTANAIGAALEFNMVKQGQDPFTPSRLFIYYNEREMEGSISEDAGAEIRDGIKSVNSQGAPYEFIWPYKIEKFAVKPSEEAYSNALFHQALVYSRVERDLLQFMTVLAEGFPFVFGFSVYTSFESPAVSQTGIVPMPSPDERMIGGHAVLCCGYDSDKQWFIVRNSWGDDWGDQGHFYMPYEYLTNENLSDDFWVIKLVE